MTTATVTPSKSGKPAKFRRDHKINWWLTAAVAVVVLKLVGLASIAILVAALVGVASGLVAFAIGSPAATAPTAATASTDATAAPPADPPATPVDGKDGDAE